MEELLIAAINIKRVTVPRRISEAKKEAKKIKTLGSTFLVTGSSAGREVTISADGLPEKTAEDGMMKQKTPT